MSYLKLTYHQGSKRPEFFSVWKKKGLEKTDAYFFEALDKKSRQPFFCNSYSPFGGVFGAYQSIASKPNMYLYNGKEYEREWDVLDYGRRRRDPWGGPGFMTIDRFAEKYHSLSPYSYAAGNPVSIIDINGDSLWVNYGKDQRMLYNNGSFYNENGSEYNGDNKFIAAVGVSLSEMNGTENGQKVLEALSGSENNFTFYNTTSRGGDRSLSFSPVQNGGGIINAAALLNSDVQAGQKLEGTAHELFHGYQYENGQGGVAVNGINNEVGAYLFGKSVTISAGYPISGFGTKTTLAGQAYERAMFNILWGDNVSQRDYLDAINNFKQGSINNANGIYNKFGINSNLSNPLIKRFVPLIR